MKRKVEDAEGNDSSTEERIVLISKSGSRYQVDRNMLHRCCNMHLARYNFYLGGLAGHLYAVSGYTTKFTDTPTVEKYIPSENRWYMVEPLPRAIPFLAGCVSNGTIYVTGKCYGQNQVYQYDPSCNKWLSKAPMLTARRFHVMTSTGKKIFAFGGKIVTHESISENAMDGEMYDVESDQWSSVSKLKFPVYKSPSITINNCLYIFQHEFLPNHWLRTFIQKINLAKFIKEKKTSNNSSLSSVQDRNGDNNIVTNDDDCKILGYNCHNGKTPFDCHYVGFMVMADN